jgi:hypothetical protein
MPRTTLATALLLFSMAGAVQAPTPPAWLTGCWALRDGKRLVEENWTSAEAGILLGTSRTVQGGRMVEYEFVVLRPGADALEYAVQLNGRPEVVFTAKPNSTNELIFENSQNPFPKRIGYRLAATDSLEAWIDGGAAGSASRIVYAYHRISCGRP